MSETDTPAGEPAKSTEHAPLLPFERWAEMAARLLKRTQDERLDLLEVYEIDPRDWGRSDQHWGAELADDLERGDEERVEHYAALCSEELRRRNGPPKEAAVAAPAPAPDEAHALPETARGIKPAQLPTAPVAALEGSLDVAVPLDAAVTFAAPEQVAPYPVAPYPVAPPAVAPPPAFASPPAFAPPPVAPPVFAPPPPVAPPIAPPVVSAPAPDMSPPPGFGGSPLARPLGARVSALNSTAPAAVMMPIPGRALPFGDKPSQDLLQPSPARPKPGVSGATMPAQVNLMALTMPFLKGREAAATAQPAQVQPAPTPAPTQPAQVQPAPAQVQPAQAQPAPAQPPARAAALPAQNAAAQSASPGMTLDAYASLCAEIVVHPERRADTLQRYGLADDAALRLLQAEWQRRFAHDPASEALWKDKYTAFREWLKQQR